MNEYISLASLFPIGRKRIDISDFVNQVDRVYSGLGLPVLYGNLSILANKSVFYIGSRGSGKTRVINLIPSVEGTLVSRWDTFTYSELSGYLKPYGGSITNKHLVFKVEEFSTFSDYHKKQFLTTVSKIISDGNFSHNTKSISINIQNCKLTILVAIQPYIYSHLCTQYTEWESLSYDRFTKFMLLDPLRGNTLDVPLIPTLPQKIDENVAFYPKRVDLANLVSLFKGHVSSGRAEIYARDYAIAIAKFMGDKELEQKHIDIFYKLFYPYLESFSKLQWRKDLNSPITVTTGEMNLLTEIGKYMDYVSKHKLAKDLKVDERSIERPAKRLLDLDLIEKSSPHAGKYRLSSELRKFFTDYQSGNIFRW